MVKKLLSITLVVLMLASLMCVNAFAEAKTVEVPVFVQDFENSTQDNLGTIADSASYPTYHFGGGGSSGRAYIDDAEEDRGFSDADENYVVLSTASTTASASRGKVYVDQSVYEKGATYKYVADVTYVTTQENVTTGKVRIGIMETNNSSAFYKPSDSKYGLSTEYTVNVGEKTTIESPEFVFSDEIDVCADVLFWWTATSKTRYTDVVFVDNVKVIKMTTIADADDNFTTDVDAGYYADAPDADEKEGIIIFGAETIDGVNEASKYGMWIYRENGEEEKVILESGDITTYKNEDGKFFATVTEIPFENFDDIVIAKPYIVVGDETIWGQTINYTVNQGNKWLGTK